MVTSVRSHASTTGMNGVISSGCVPARVGPVSGTEEASSARYLRTVRQSQPHSRPISTNVAPAACKARKRRMFIQDSVSRIMSRSPFGSSAWRWTNRRVTQLKTSRDSTRRATPQVVPRTTYEVVRGHRTARKRLGNRVVGEIELTGDALDLAGDGLTMIAYSAEPGSQAEDQLKPLAAWSATVHTPASEPAGS